ncbi:hypothetical protein P4604_21445 [Lysinibacillus capsici]|uniref:hypothetical protein n=1 Tax=Lysinibacillus capsici TaxID=2115968 RepID=UPI002E20634F|nr:hypothetical protein [Lysinibacillus capsici]
MEYFDRIFLTNHFHRSSGNFEIILYKLVIDCEGMKDYFETLRKTSVMINEIEFYKGDELIKGYSYNFRVKSVVDNKAELIII